MKYSYGLQSEHIFDRFIGEIFETDKYICVRHPDNPDYFFGNYLLLRPGEYNKKQLEEDFSSIIGSSDVYNHKMFQWLKGELEIELQPFIEDGYKFMATKVLTANETTFKSSKTINSEVTILSFNSDDHWQKLFDLEMLQRAEDEPIEGYKAFLHGKIRMYKAMVNAEQGQWFGAFINSELVGSVGFFHDDKMGRFQSVLTHPDYRGQGICKTIVSHACNYALTKTSRLIMLADSDYHAAKIYEGLGFECIEDISSLYWWKKE